MLTFFTYILVTVSLMTAGTALAQPPVPREGGTSTSKALIEQARRDHGDRVRYAELQKAEIRSTSDGRSFYLLWLPPTSGTSTTPPRMIVTLHGSNSFAFDEFFLWHKLAAQLGMGILALQWWHGEGSRYQDYLAPHEIYREIDIALRPLRLPPGSAVLHGFSRGSANSYAVVALDNNTNRYFGLAIANAGKPGKDFPGNVAIERGQFGPRPFNGTRWVLYCGGRDPHPDRDGCPGMREASNWLTGYGATISLFIEDSQGDHGGFHRNPANMRRAMEQVSR